MPSLSYDGPDSKPETRLSLHAELDCSTRLTSIVGQDYGICPNSLKATSCKLKTQGTFLSGRPATTEDVPEGIVTRPSLVNTPWLTFSSLRLCRWQRRPRAGALACREISSSSFRFCPST